MQEFRITLGQNGELPLPEMLRRELHVRPGDELVIAGDRYDMRVYRGPDMHRRMEALSKLRRMLRESVPPDVSLVDEFLAERRAEAAREEAKYGRHTDGADDSGIA